MTARDVLLAAADVIECNGWCQDDAGRVGGPRCVLGALRQACLPELPGLAHAEAHGRLRTFVHASGASFDLIAWNDAPGRTAAEVIAALRGAAGAQPFDPEDTLP